MTLRDLDEIERDSAAATPGPWRHAYPLFRCGHVATSADWTDKRGDRCPDRLGCSLLTLDGWDDDPEDTSYAPVAAPDGSYVARLPDVAGPPRTNDMRFIANARTDVPALVAEVRRLHAEVARLQQQIDPVEARDFTDG